MIRSALHDREIVSAGILGGIVASPGVDPLMEKIVSLCKRRGFVFQSSEIYGGLNSCWDFGPIGVEPDAQGRRIGQQLMAQYCEQLDHTGQAGYLETDRPENVKFYTRFGFETTDEILVPGIRNYLMKRKARSKSTA